MTVRKGFLGPDPVFLMVLGLCPVIVGAATLRDGIVLGGGVAFTVLIAGLAAPFANRVVVPALRRLSNAAIAASAAVLWSLGIAVLAPEAWQRLFPWLALVGVNCLTLGAAGGEARDEELSRFPSRLAAAARYFASSLLISSIRELLGTGSLVFYADDATRLAFDAVRLEGPLLRIASLPAGAFIIFGFSLAAARLIRGARKRSEA